MNKKDLWSIFIKKNPRFVDKGASFTANGLKKFFETVYSQGHDHGFNNGKAYQQMHRKKEDPATDFMKGVFGI